MIDCAVVGASGYAGAELCSLLALHPAARLRSLHADASAGQRFEDLYPARAHEVRGRLRPFVADELAGLDVVFLALPHGASARAAQALVGKVGHIIDLSGDLRLADAATYKRWYGADHPAPELLGRAVYGLPELFADQLPGAPLVACAGCYATITQIAAYPALPRAGEGADEGASIVVSAVSGTTGAGRKGDLDLSFSEVAENLRAYRVGRHQHVPEIEAGLGRRARRPVRVTLVPHLAPFPRGIFATVVVPNRDELGQGEILDRFRKAYAGQPFVRVLDPRERLPEVRDVLHTNFAAVAPVVDAEGGTLVVLGVIDNLVKGAAGQAVQVLNLVCGLDATAGLLAAAKEDS